ncbi:MAG: sulfatase-like hydrolase/transferase [Terriglobia bacterium]
MKNMNSRRRSALDLVRGVVEKTVASASGSAALSAPTRLVAAVALLFTIAGVSMAMVPALAASAYPPAQASEITPSIPNVIIVTVDTLRPDHLACYGDKHIRTPNLDRLAQVSTRFTQAFTPVPITLPAHTCLFTGSYPMATGVHDFSGNRLSPKIPTLAAVLREHGYVTAAFVSAAVLDSRFGLKQGFDTYYDHFNYNSPDASDLDEVRRRGDQVTDLALNWLRDREKSTSRQPFLLWVHLYDCHAPYEPPEPYASRYPGRPYDGAIAFDDAQVGRLLDDIDHAGWLSRSIIVLCGDHGEGLGEHGEKTHGFFVYNSTLHIPLLIKIPDAKPGVISQGVSLVDVMPTVLQALRFQRPPTVQGRSLLSAILGRSAGSQSNLYAESYLPLLHFHWSQLRSLELHGWQYIDAPRPELYDTRTDPQELHNLYPQRQSAGRELHDRLFDFLRLYTPIAGNATAQKDLTDPALLERLRSLGYVAISAGTFSDSSGKQLPDPKDRIGVYELFSAAMSDGQHGRLRQALEKLDRAGKIEPDSIPIEYLEGLDEYKLHNYPQAIERFGAALKLDPKFSMGDYYLGLVQIQMGDLDGAAAHFEQTLKLDPQNFSAAYNLGAIDVKGGRVLEAMSRFKQAAEINPNYEPALEAMGQLLLYENHPQSAIEPLQRAVNLAPSSATAHQNLGRALQAAGRTEEARRQFNLAAQLASQSKSQ